MIRQLNLKSTGATFFTTLAAVMFCCLLFSSSYTYAADYTIIGQVFQVSSEEAADENIPVENLTMERLPFVHIQIHNKETGELLAECDAGINGQYNASFSLSPVPPGLAIQCCVYKLLDENSQLLQPARLDINSLDPVDSFNIKKLLVISDDFIEYQEEQSDIPQGVGIVFTRVGLVPTRYILQPKLDIPQNIAEIGLADVPDDAPGYVPKFKIAPFGSGLLIYGDFGIPEGTGCPNRVDWYSVTIQKINESASNFNLNEYSIVYVDESPVPYMDPLSKIKTTIQTSPIFDITKESEVIGPHTMVEDGTDALIPGLYKVNRNAVGGGTNVFYSFPDLRIDWNTSSLNGLYEISVQYYTEVEPLDENDPPKVKLIEMGNCFVETPQPGEIDNAALHKLILRVNNQALDVHFGVIYLRNDVGDCFSVDTDCFNFNNNDPNNPLDRCKIMNLQGGYRVEIHFTAHHEGGYMRNYCLYATSNDGSKVKFLVDPDPEDVNNPLLLDCIDFNRDSTIWYGTPAAGDSAVNQVVFPHDCAYIIDLIGNSRVQNGKNYIQWAHRRKTYYIRLD